ncbi:MAG: hypothetical protein DRN35_03295 [Thermoplasmata archaeon]|nr:MAG: hypothetical protein DRN35_03295 [Thermoplasmata archaeon]
MRKEDSSLDPEEFWSRQDRLWPGLRGKAAGLKLTVVGVGATGSYAALFAAQMGFRRITLVDPDRVEMSNLNRTLYTLDHIGMRKVDALAEILREKVPGVHVRTLKRAVETLRWESVEADLILSCLDVVDARFYLASRAYRADAPLFDVGTEGERIRVQASIPPGPCLACTVPEELYGEVVGLKDSCTAPGEEHAPSGPLVPPIAAALLLRQVKDHLMGRNVIGEIIYMDLPRLEVRRERIKRNPSCFICSSP